MSLNVNFIIELLNEDGKWVLINKEPIKFNGIICEMLLSRKHKNYNKENLFPEDANPETKKTITELLDEILKDELTYSKYVRSVPFSFDTMIGIEEIYYTMRENWNKFVKRNINKEKDKSIISELRKAKNEIINAITKKGNYENTIKETDAQLDYEDSIDYAIKDELEELIELKESIYFIEKYVQYVTNSPFLNPENIRVYYFFN